MIQFSKIETGMYRISRNLQICSGIKACGVCLKFLKPLESGSMRIAAWALKHNEILIDQAIMACPNGAIKLERIK